MGSPSIPPPQPLPPPITPTLSPAFQQARDRLRRLSAARRGLKSTVLTGPAGVRPLPSLASPSLMPTQSQQQRAPATPSRGR